MFKNYYHKVIYFLNRKDDETVIKIGFTKLGLLTNRIKSMSGIEKDRWNFLAAFLCNDNDEYQIHEFFKSERIEGETFRSSKRMLDYIENLTMQDWVITPETLNEEILQETVHGLYVSDCRMPKNDTGLLNGGYFNDGELFRPSTVRSVQSKQITKTLSANRKIKKLMSAERELDEWVTPDLYTSLARFVMGDIDLDPASSKEANIYVKAHDFYTIDDDGLSSENKWSGRIFLHPPNNQKAGFLNIAANYLKEEKIEIIVLVPISHTTAWFNNLYPVNGSPWKAICFPYKRIHVLGAHSKQNKKAQSNPPIASCFIYGGENIKLFIEIYSMIGPIFTCEGCYAASLPPKTFGNKTIQWMHFKELGELKNIILK